MDLQYCRYFQGTIVREKIWFVVGALKSQENLCFDRAYIAEKNQFEFFVTQERLTEFLDCMKYFQQCGYLQYFAEYPNRVKIEGKI